MSHHGDPEVEEVDDGEEEVEVLEEPEVEVLEEGRPDDGRGEGPRVLKAPRAPTQREIDAHMATHLPHAAWCDICMKGRGRNSPHRRNPIRWARRPDGQALQMRKSQSVVDRKVRPPLPGLLLKRNCTMVQSLV